MAVAVGVLLLVGGCVSRTGEPSAASTTTGTTTTSSQPSTGTADPAIADEAAARLATGSYAPYDFMCEQPHAPAPPRFGADFAGTQPAGIDTYVLPVDGEAVVARLTVEPGLDLMLAVMLRFGTDEWCAYAMTWCPVEFTGLPPLAVDNSVIARMEEPDREVLCGR